MVEFTFFALNSTSPWLETLALLSSSLFLASLPSVKDAELPKLASQKRKYDHFLLKVGFGTELKELLPT